MSTKLISVNRKLSAQKYNSTSVTPYQAASVATDTYFNRTTLLLHGDGTNGANNTVFVDSSTNAFTITTVGKPLQGTFSPYSQTGWSNYFDGSGDYLSLSNSASLKLSTSVSWTIEGFFYLNGSSGTDRYLVVQSGTYSAGNDAMLNYMLRVTTSNVLRFLWVSGSTASFIDGSTTVTTNTWNHIAVSFDGTNVRMYLNGVHQSSSTFTAVNTQTATTWLMGGLNFIPQGSSYTQGFLSNFRYVSGTAVYSGSGSFTPPTTPLTAISNTSLLTCQDNRFKDNSSNAFTVTPSGDASVLPFSPFSPTAAYSNTVVGGSVYFNGSSDYFTTPYSTANFDWYTAGTDYTLECWVFPISLTGFGYLDASTPKTNLIGNNAYNNTNNYWTFGPYTDGTVGLTYFNGSSVGVFSTAKVIVNQWNHIAFTKTSSGITIFVNGVASSTTAISGTPQSGTAYPLTIGAGNNAYINGYVSNLRILKGTAQYSGNFTPPTAPLTAVTNTKLLLNATNAGIIDHTAKNVITTAAGANISTTQSKYGGSSISLSGTSTGYLQMLNTRFNNIPASTDFTLECWLYTTASSTAPNVWHNVSSQKIVAFYLSDSGFNNLDTIMGPFSYPGSNASVVRGTTDVVANTWTHVAFVRSGSTITVYVNGTACGTGTSSYASLPLQLIGAISTGATTPDFYYFPGYIDDLRLTIGVARYTSNFTPKTSAFEDQ